MVGKDGDRLAFLDVARGVAALAVVLDHGISRCVADFQSFRDAWFWPGRFGVLLFFLISGFIIPVSLERAGSLGRFWWRRFFRLYPLYWFSIGAALLYLEMGGRFGARLSGPVWLLNLTMLQGFFQAGNVLGVFWTLHFELILYLGLSLLFLIGWSRRLVLLALAVLAIYTIVALWRTLVMQQPAYIGGNSLLFVAAFVGAILYRCKQERIVGELWAAAVVLLGAGPVLIWCVNALWLPASHTLAAETGKLTCWLAAYALFAVLLTWDTLPMPGMLRWLGLVSYSVYLLHPLSMDVLKSMRLPAWLFLPGLIASTLAVAAVTYYLIEAPAIRLGRYLESRRPAAPAKTGPRILRYEEFRRAA